MITDGKVFNKLTDNGNIQGLFMDNGQLYVNGEYINTRNFSAVTDDGEQTFLIDADGKVFNKLTDNGFGRDLYLDNG